MFKEQKARWDWRQGEEIWQSPPQLWEDNQLLLTKDCILFLKKLSCDLECFLLQVGAGGVLHTSVHLWVVNAKNKHTMIGSKSHLLFSDRRQKGKYVYLATIDRNTDTSKIYSRTKKSERPINEHKIFKTCSGCITHQHTPLKLFMYSELCIQKCLLWSPFVLAEIWKPSIIE